MKTTKILTALAFVIAVVAVGVYYFNQVEPRAFEHTQDAFLIGFHSQSGDKNITCQAVHHLWRAFCHEGFSAKFGMNDKSDIRQIYLSWKQNIQSPSLFDWIGLGISLKCSEQEALLNWLSTTSRDMNKHAVVDGWSFGKRVYQRWTNQQVATNCELFKNIENLTQACLFGLGRGEYVLSKTNSSSLSQKIDQTAKIGFVFASRLAGREWLRAFKSFNKNELHLGNLFASYVYEKYFGAKVKLSNEKLFFESPKIWSCLERSRHPTLCLE